jgi:hypothetical protein
MSFSNQSKIGMSVEIMVLLDKDNIVICFIRTELPDSFEVPFFEVFFLKFHDDLVAFFKLTESVHEDVKVYRHLFWRLGFDVLGYRIDVTDFVPHKCPQKFAVVLRRPV